MLIQVRAHVRPISLSEGLLGARGDNVCHHGRTKNGACAPVHDDQPSANRRAASLSASVSPGGLPLRRPCCSDAPADAHSGRSGHLRLVLRPIRCLLAHESDAAVASALPIRVPAGDRPGTRRLDRRTVRHGWQEAQRRLAPGLVSRVRAPARSRIAGQSLHEGLLGTSATARGCRFRRRAGLSPGLVSHV